MSGKDKVSLILIALFTVSIISKLISWVFWLIPIFMVTALDYPVEWLWALTLSILGSIVINLFGILCEKVGVDAIEDIKKLDTELGE